MALVSLHSLMMVELMACSVVVYLFTFCLATSSRRFASAAFVTGGLDPYTDPKGWLQAARTLRSPLTVVVADQSPPKSLAEMQALAAVADRVLHLPGRLGAHEELGAELARLLGGSR